MNVHRPIPSMERLQVLNPMAIKATEQYSLTNSSINLFNKRPLILKTLKNQMDSFLCQLGVDVRPQLVIKVE